MKPRLVAITGPIKGTTIPLEVPETVVGRDPSNGVPINDPLVSRRHCSILNSSGQIRLVDLESLNGTFVNGTPTREKTRSAHRNSFFFYATTKPSPAPH